MKELIFNASQKPSEHVERFQGCVPQKRLIISPLKTQQTSSNIGMLRYRRDLEISVSS